MSLRIVIGLGLALSAQVIAEVSRFQAFRLPAPRLLYRKPLLASGPAENVQQALPAGTEVLLVAGTRSRDWIFVRTDSKLEGWIPATWVQAPYSINPAAVRSRYYPRDLPPELGFDFRTDVDVWGGDLLLEALRDQ